VPETAIGARGLQGLGPACGGNSIAVVVIAADERLVVEIPAAPVADGGALFATFRAPAVVQSENSERNQPSRPARCSPPAQTPTRASTWIMTWTWNDVFRFSA
jgi:hypothetical protein